VSASAILTARHVVDPEQKSTRGERVEPDTVQITGRFSHGEMRPDELIFHQRPEVDLALIVFHPPKGISLEFRCPVHKDPAINISVGDEVLCHGFAELAGDVQAAHRRVAAVDGRAGAYVGDASVPQGFSGGPALSDGALVGIMYARNHEQLQCYFYGGKALADILRHIPSESIDWTPRAAHRLRRFPLGPGISPGDTTSRLHIFIRNCTKLFSGIKAIETIAIANAARRECGPDTGDKGLIDIAELPDPSIRLFEFWLTAIVQAGQKSPRMLAAILSTIDTDLLEPASRGEKARMLDWLENLQ